MYYARLLASAPCALLILALCAGCDGAPRKQSTTSAHRSPTPDAVPQEFAFDRQAPGSANKVPTLEGTAGTLRYRSGCLFLDAGSGNEIGLVVPAGVTFDGRRMIGKLTTPGGRPIIKEIGQLVSLSGPLMENPPDGRYGCDTKMVLIADQF
jgi:hypothetical protein